MRCTCGMRIAPPDESSTVLGAVTSQLLTLYPREWLRKVDIRFIGSKYGPRIPPSKARTGYRLWVRTGARRRVRLRWTRGMRMAPPTWEGGRESERAREREREGERERGREGERERVSISCERGMRMAPPT